MKTLTLPVLAAVFLVCSLPSANVRSQAMPQLPADPLTALQTLQNANDELIKRQEATLKELTDLTVEAREAKVFARRG